MQQGSLAAVSVSRTIPFNSFLVATQELPDHDTREGLRRREDFQFFLSCNVARERIPEDFEDLIFQFFLSCNLRASIRDRELWRNVQAFQFFLSCNGVTSVSFILNENGSFNSFLVAT